MANTPIIVLNWNGITDTIECVESILTQTNQHFDIFLIDNNSQNNEFAELHERYQHNQKIELIQNKANLGFTLAHNQLFDQFINSNAEFVALINNDAVADKYWLENAMEIARTENADMVACLMMNYFDREIVDSAGLFLLSTGEILPLGHGHSVNELPKAIYPIAACGGACLYRISMLKEIGGFDPYFSTGYEDAELGLRAFLSGRTIAFASKAIVYHKMSQSVSKVFDRNKAQKIQEDINYTCLKLMPAGAICVNAVLNVPRWIFMLLLHLITLRFRFVTVQLAAFAKTAGELKQIIGTRREFKRRRKKGSLSLLKAQKFFLVYDLKRFNRLLLKRDKNQFEKY